MLEQFSIQPPAIVVQDFDLGPGKMTGLEVLKKAREIKPTVDFIFLSGQNSINIAVDIIKNGAYDYVIKDDTAQENLLNRIKRLVFQVKLIRSEKVFRRGLIVFAGVLIITIIICYLIGVRLAIH